MQTERCRSSILETADPLPLTPPPSPPGSPKVTYTSPATDANLRGRSVTKVNDSPNYIVAFFDALSDAVQHVADVVKRNLTHLKKSDPGVMNTFGAGMESDGNACYIIATLQALRFTGIRTKITPQNDFQRQIEQDIFDLFDIAEGGNGKRRQTVSVKTVKAFKAKMIQMGFQADNATSQEDAQLFVQFLLDQAGMPLSQVRIRVHHGLDVRVPSFEVGVEQNILPLSINHAQDGTAVQDLTLANVVEEEVEARNIQNQLSSLPPEKRDDYLKKLEEFTPSRQIDTLQSTHLSQNTLPFLMPVAVKRYFYDRATGESIKVVTKILPSANLYFPLVEDPRKFALYELKSIIVHDGRRIKNGHYYTYVPKVIDGETVWIEYNNEKVYVHRNVTTQGRDPWQNTPYEDACKNGYVYFYEFVGYR